MRKMLIWGAQGWMIYEKYKESYEIIAFVDNDPSKWKQGEKGEISIISPADMLKLDFDMVAIASMSYKEILNQLLFLGVPLEKIIYNDYVVMVDGRIKFLNNLAQMFNVHNISSSCNDTCVAELGVYRGEFAHEISIAFPSKRLYLFDTFDGFDDRDVMSDNTNNYSQAMVRSLSNTSVQLVVDKIVNPARCVIRKGYFPETAQGLEGVKYCYVNIDVDLYQPTLEGLKYFYPRMIRNGVITIHDYYGTSYRGVAQAVNEFKLSHINLKMCPLGDGLSLAIIK